MGGCEEIKKRKDEGMDAERRMSCNTLEGWKDGEMEQLWKGRMQNERKKGGIGFRIRN